MSTYITHLDINFNTDDLNYIRTAILGFHNSNRTNLLSKYNPGNTLHKPSLGYYIPLFKSTHADRNVSSWVELNSISDKDLNIDIIKMNITDKLHQNLYVVNPVSSFNEEFYNTLTRILDNIPVDFQRESATASVQEFGYSMKFHTDAGVTARVHINLNEHSADYFYTSDGCHQMEYGKCYLFEASKTQHGFMSFQTEPRMHLIMDII